MAKRALIITLLVFESLIQGCFVYKKGGSGVTLNTIIKNQESFDSTLSTVTIANDQITINGTGFSKVTRVEIKGNGVDASLSVTSASETQIIAKTTSALALLASGTFDLIIGTASAQATYPVTFTLQDGAVTAAKLASMGASSGQVLKYNGSVWAPASLASSQIYLGTWNANTNTPDLSGLASPQSGDYYIVSTAGTYSGITYAVGDWTIYNGSTWDKIDNTSNVVASFKGRKGVVTPASGDYTWAQITKTSSKLEDIADINVTTRNDGDVLLWNAGTSKWVSSTFSSTPPAGSVGTSQLANTSVTYGKLNLSDGDIPQAKVNGLVSALSGKEPTLTAGTSAQYYRGDKTWQTLSSSAVAEGSNLYFTNARVLGATLDAFSSTNSAIVATDTVLQAFNKTQGQINNLSTTSGSFLIKNNVDTLTGQVTVDSTTGSLLLPRTPSDTETTAAANVDYVKTYADTKLAKSGGTLTSDLILNTLVKFKDSATNYVTVKAPTTVTANYTLTLPTTAGTSGYVLKTDGSGNLSWVDPTTTAPGSGTVSGSSIAAGAITDTNVSATAAIAQSKISGLTTSLAGKEGTITAGTTAQYYRGDKTWSTLATDVGTSVLSAYAIGTNAALAATDTVNSAFGKVQAQLNNVISSVLSTFAVDSGSKPTVTTSDTIVSGFGKVQKYLNDLNGDYVSKTDNTATNTVTGQVTFNSIGTLKINYTPTNATDAVNKSYVDSFGLWTKNANGTDIGYTAGNVGIGTTAPGSALEMNAPVSTFGNTQFKVTDGTTGGYFSVTEGATGATTYLPTFNFSSAATNGYGGAFMGLIPSANDVYVGAGAAIVLDGRTTANAALANANLLSVRNNGTSYVTVKANGNVGVGTTNPAHKLDVTGGSIKQVNGSDGNDGIMLYNQSGTRNAVLYSSGTSYFAIQAENSTRMAFRSSGGSEAMTIASNSNVGIGITSPTSPLQISKTDTTTSGTIYGGLQITPTYNQASATTGNTDLLINRTETSVGSGNQRLIDAQVGGVSKFYVTNSGVVYLASTLSGSTYAASGAYNGSGNSNDTNVTINNKNISSVGYGTALTTGTISNTSGSFAAVQITPTYNEASSTASNTDLYINRTETAVGSGTQYLINAALGGTTKFNVNTTGQMTVATSIGLNGYGLGAQLGLGGAINTGLAGSTSGRMFDIASSTITRNNDSGTVAHAVEASIQTPTFAAGAATTYTNASTFYIGGPPTAGTNATITNGWAAYINGATYLGGNVGVGTTTPGTSMHIYKAAANSLQIPLLLQNADITNGGSATAIGFRVTSAANSDKAAIAFERTAGNGRGKLHFLLNSAADTTSSALTDAKVSIDYGGNVGIGTTSPDNQLTIITPGSSAANNKSQIKLVSTSGNIGVSGAEDIIGGIDFVSNDMSNYTTTAAIRAITTGNHSSPNLPTSLVFHTYGTAAPLTERMRIDHSGNVGIGTTSPSNLLHVYTATASATVANFQSGTGSCTVVPNTGMSCSSDLRLKEDVEEIMNGLDKVLHLRGVTFQWRERSSQDSTRHMGFIAQELEKVAPELVREDSKGFKQVNYANFVAVLTEAIKDFYRKWFTDSVAIHREIAAIKAENAKMKAESSEMRKALCELGKKSFCH